MNDERPDTGLSDEELAAQGATALPDKEVVSILDLNADIDLAIDAAAPIDLAVAANANVAAPIDAAVGANVLSVGSTAQALSDQGVIINQGLDADASAHAVQDSALDQSNDTVDAGGTAPADATASPAVGSTALGDTGAATDGLTGTAGDTAGTVGDTVGGAVGDTTGAVGDTAGTVGDTAGTVGDTAGTVGDTVGGATGDLGGTVGGATDAAGGLLDGNLLNVDVNVNADADIAAPINGAVAANANVAAPIDAAVGANVGSVDSNAVAVSQQDAIINQDITGSADATSDQTSDITQ
ncbi:MAG TPA: hypothetical protein VFP51_05575 [Nocardioidaceae bacterium]|jgi:hypothetical protein|nr:hypothetical protein [Nocardioidaceae bacterium]